MAAPDLAHVVHIPWPKHLEDEVAAIGRLSRNEAVAAIKGLKIREFAALAEHQADHLGEITGADIALQITGVTDLLVKQLAERAALKAGAPEDWSEQVGVFAVGGYGRGELNPFSDLDVMLVVGLGERPAWVSALSAEFQALAWDVKFTVGASLRGLAELPRLIAEDFVTATALIEQRPVLAGAALQQGLVEVLEAFRRTMATPFLRYKLDELAKRRAQAGASVFLMEPNLKTNPGCLRDVQLLRNIAFAVFGSRNLLSLADLESITRGDLGDVLAANDHLLALRSLLHFHHGRKQDVFQLADQVRVAKQYGYGDVSHLRAVEHFMRRHYAQVRQVHQIVDLTVSRLTALGHLGPKPLLVKTRVFVGGGTFSIIADQVYLAERGFWRAPDAGVRLLTLCREAQQRGARLSYELQREIRAHLAVIGEATRTDGAAAQAFLAMLGDLGRIRPILSDMHNCGLLGAYLPEFGNLTCHMQFDSYHQYTVDEHTLIALGNLDLVANGKATGLPGMSRLLGEVARKDLLALALLLHDVGKYMGRGHVARGALMVENVARRLGLTRDEEDFVYFLVERHVSLSDASRMRNFHEPAFLRTFAERMGTVANLNALYCLTWCDAKAVGEGILTGWQEAILAELRDAVAQQITHGGIDRAGRHERLVWELGEQGLDRAAAEAFLAGLDHTYEHQVLPGEAARHHRVLTECRAGGLGLAWETTDKYVLLTAAVPDRHGLMADCCAILSGHGFDIIDLRTWIMAGTVPTVLYTMRLTTIYPARLTDDDLWTKLRKDLLAVSHGQGDATKLLARRRSALVPRPADSGFDDPAVKVEQRTSDHHTIVDVHTKDEVGLLSRLCRTISDHGGEIGYACINTMGDVAVDVFYVTRTGAKLTDDDAEALRARLIAALNLRG